MQESEIEKKMYSHIISRMKNDLLVYQAQELERRKSLQQIKVLKAQAELKLQQITLKEANSSQALKEVINYKQKLDEERQKQSEQFNADIELQAKLENQKIQRQKRQAEIAEIAQTDIRDTNVKKWRELMIVNQFFESFLKLKMEREMANNEEIEKAFQRIKASTGISDAGEIVHKFLNRENTYSHLLVSIEQYEKNIDVLKKKNEQLKMEFQTLKEEQPQEKQEQKQTLLEIEELKNKYENIEAKAKNAGLVKKLASSWAINYLWKIEKVLGVSQGNKDIYKTKYLPDNTLKVFTEIFGHLKIHLLNQNEEEIINVVQARQKEMVNDPDIETIRRNNRVSNITEDSRQDLSQPQLPKPELNEKITQINQGKNTSEVNGNYTAKRIGEVGSFRES